MSKKKLMRIDRDLRHAKGNECTKCKNAKVEVEVDPIVLICLLQAPPVSISRDGKAY